MRECMKCSPCHMLAQYAFSLIPRSHPQEGKGLGPRDIEEFCLAHHHVFQYKLMQKITIAELAEPRISANIHRPFPHVLVGSGNETNILSVLIFFNVAIGQLCCICTPNMPYCLGKALVCVCVLSIHCVCMIVHGCTCVWVFTS